MIIAIDSTIYNYYLRNTGYISTKVKYTYSITKNSLDGLSPETHILCVFHKLVRFRVRVRIRIGDRFRVNFRNRYGPLRIGAAICKYRVLWYCIGKYAVNESFWTISDGRHSYVQTNICNIPAVTQLRKIIFHLFLQIYDIQSLS